MKDFGFVEILLFSDFLTENTTLVRSKFHQLGLFSFLNFSKLKLNPNTNTLVNCAEHKCWLK